jgi:hypothetical protein
MGLYTKLADDIGEVDVIIAGGTFPSFTTRKLHIDSSF